jgi:hypothetical protein
VTWGVKFRRVRVTTVAGGEAIRTLYSEWLSVALVSYAKRIRRIILSPVSCPVYYMFPHYLTNDRISGGKLLNKKMCFDFL